MGIVLSDTLKSLSHSFYKYRIRISYITALLLIGVLVAISFTSLQQSSIAQERTLEIIRLHARQRSLSQRIALLSSLLVNESEQRSQYQSELQIHIEQMRVNLQAVLSGAFQDADEPALMVQVDDQLLALYTEGAPPLSVLLDDYLAAATALTASPDTPPTQENANYTFIIVSSTELLQRLDTIITEYQGIAEAQLDAVQFEEMIILGVILLTLLLEGLFIFLPLERRILKNEATAREETESIIELAEQFAQSEARYRQLLETMNESLVICDDKENITYANTQFYNLLGYEADNIVGHPLPDFLDAASRPLIDEHNKYRLRGESSRYELIFIRKDGERVYTSVSGSPVVDSKGGVQGSFGIITDITARRRLEQDLRASEMRYRMIMDTMNEVFIVRDARHLISYANNQFYHMLGYDTEAVFGHPIEDFLDAASRQTVADQTALRLKGESSRYELTFIHKDGTKVYTSVSGTPTFDTEGNYQGSFGIVTNITERKGTDEAVRRSEALYRQVVRNLPDTAVLMFDRDLRYTLAEGPFLETMGYFKDRVEGKTLREIVTPEVHAVVLPYYETALHGDEIKFERPLVNKPEIIYHSQFAPIHDEHGRISGGMVVMRNITEQKHAEQEIRRKEQLLRTVIDNSPSHIYVKDTESRFLLANQSIVTHMGYQQEVELMGKSDFDTYPLNIAEQLRADEIALMTANVPLLNHEEHLTNYSTGQNIWILANKIPLKDEQGNVIGLVGINHDITERKRTEEEMRNKEQLLRTVIDNSTSHIYVKDTESRFLLVNKAMLPNVGVTSEAELLGKTDFDILTQDAEHFRETEIELMNTGIPILDQEESWLNINTGEPLWFLVNKIPLRDENGNVIGLVGLNHDITARKRAEEETRSKEQLLRTVIDNSPGHIYVKDTESRFLLANKAALPNLGIHSEAELLGKTDFDILGPEAAQQFRDDEIELMSTGIPVLDQEASWLSIKTGETLWFLVNKIPLRDENGKIIGLVGLNHDITDRKRAEQALQEKQEFIERVTSAVPDVIYIYDLIDGRTHYINRSVVDGLGYTTDDIMRMGDTFARDIMHPDDLARQAELFAHIARDKNPNVIIENEYRVRHSGGSWRWFYSRDAIFDWTEDGKPRQVLGVTRDITEHKKDEEALQEKQEFIERITSAIPDTIYILDMTFQLALYINHPLQEVLGYSQQEIDQLGGDFLRMVMHPDDLLLHPNLLGRAPGDQRAVVENEYRLRAANGEWRWFLSRDVIFDWAEGEPSQLLGVIRDITALKQVQDELHERQAFIEHVTSAVPDVIYLYDLIDGHTNYMNHPVSVSLGYMSKEVQDMGFAFVMTIMHPDDVARQANILANLSRDDTNIFENEFRMKHANGEWRWFLSRDLVYSWTEDGQPRQLLGIARDITALKTAQDELRERQEFIEHVTSAVPDVIYLYDLTNGQTYYINHPFSASLGYADEESKQMGISFIPTIMHPDDLANLSGIYANIKVGDTTSIIENEFRVKHADGEWHWLLSRDIVFNWTEDGKPRQMLGVTRDITEQKNAHLVELDLESEKQRVQVLSNFIRDTSHDFRTPITIISTALEILPHLTDEQRRSDKIARIRSYVDYLVRMLNQLQRMASLDTTTHVDLRPLDINQMMDDLLLTFQAKANDKNLTLVSELGDNLPRTLANAETLQEAFTHLFNNAIFFTREGGTIGVRTALQDDHVLIEIRDTGIGIPTSDLSHVFDRFYKVDQSRPLTTGGAGMGLAIVKRIVDLHQGSIEVQSTPGEGSTFTMLLPLVTETANGNLR